MSIIRTNGGGSGFSTLPFDKHDSIRSLVYVEDFVAADAATIVSAGTDVAVPGTNMFVDGVSDSIANVTLGTPDEYHSGVLVLETGATTPAAGDLGVLSYGPSQTNQIVLDNGWLYVGAVVQIPDVDAQKVALTLTADGDELINASGANALSLVFDPADVANVGDEFFIAQSNIGGVDVEFVMDEASYVEGDWVLLEIAANEDEAYFRVSTTDGQVDVAYSDATPTVALGARLAVETVGAAEETLPIDKFAIRHLVPQESSVDYVLTVAV